MADHRGSPKVTDVERGRSNTRGSIGLHRQKGKPGLQMYGSPTGLDVFGENDKKTKKTRAMRMAVMISFVILAMSTAVVVGTYFGIRTDRKVDISYPGAADYPPKPSNSILGVYQRQSVAADASQCSEMGNAILLKNGSAVEAAITTALCAGLIHPHSCGIGGGFFMVAYQHDTQNATAIDAREMAPAAATEHMFVDTNISSVKGWHAAGVPGEIAGYWKAFQLFKSGNLEWRDLFEPVIKLARDGITVNAILASAIKDADTDILTFDDMLKSLFAKNDTTVMVEGDVYKNPVLAHTLEIIANDPKGSEEFYHGVIAKDLAEDINSGGGIISLNDLGNYTVIIQPALHSKLADNSNLYGVPPPAGNLVLQYIMSIMDGYGYGSDNKTWLDMDDQEKILFYQRFSEAMKFGYARRTEMGDPSQLPHDNPVNEMKDVLLSPWFASLTRNQIMDEKTSEDPRTYGVKSVQQLGKHGTSHISVIDQFGNAASITTTINTHFGARKVSKSTGIIMNNEMDDFTTNPNMPNYYGLPPSKSNLVSPGKRPQSSCAPTIITDHEGAVKVVIGASGGSRITSAIANALVRILYLDQNVKEAIDAPRLHHQLLPMQLEYENDFMKTHLKGLYSFRHQLYLKSSIGSVVQGLVRSVNGSIYANCDYRKKGAPAGL